MTVGRILGDAIGAPGVTALVIPINAVVFARWHRSTTPSPRGRR